MNLLGYRAFATELLKIATEVRDPEIRAMIAESNGKEYLQGGRLNANAETETNFKPKIASPYMHGYEVGRKLASLMGFSQKIAAGFMAYTPVGTYNVRGKKPTAQGSGYETASNFAGTALRGGMTGAGAATLGHTLMRGHEAKLLPKHLGAAVAGGAGLALADRAFRRHAMKKQLTKLANMGTFSPARQLHSTQSQGDFENKVHHTPLKPAAGIIGNNFRMPQGA